MCLLQNHGSWYWLQWDRLIISWVTFDTTTFNSPRQFLLGTWWNSSTLCYYQSLLALHCHSLPRTFFLTMLSGPTFTNTSTGKLSQILHMDACKYLLASLLTSHPRDNWKLILEIMSTKQPLSSRTWLSLPKIHLSWELISIVFSIPTVLAGILCRLDWRRHSPHTLLCKR